MPTSTAERRTGRASTASAIPDSNSPASTGPARKAVPSAAIRLRPNITRLSTVEAASRASPVVSVAPNSASIRENPKALSASSTIVSPASARSTRRREASLTVRAAKVSTTRAVIARRPLRAGWQGGGQ